MVATHFGREKKRVWPNHRKSRRTSTRLTFGTAHHVMSRSNNGQRASSWPKTIGRLGVENEYRDGKALLWCAIINYGILLVWFLFFMLAHEWMYLYHGRWFRLSAQQFDMLHYAGMLIFELGIILLNLVPYFALGIARRA